MAGLLPINVTPVDIAPVVANPLAGPGFPYLGQSVSTFLGNYQANNPGAIPFPQPQQISNLPTVQQAFQNIQNAFGGGNYNPVQAGTQAFNTIGSFTATPSGTTLGSGTDVPTVGATIGTDPTIRFTEGWGLVAVGAIAIGLSKTRFSKAIVAILIAAIVFQLIRIVANKGPGRTKILALEDWSKSLSQDYQKIAT